MKATPGIGFMRNHYYPFGLTMAGISSKALKSGYAENNKKYNGIEFENDLDLNTYDAYYRELDPQSGRWWQIDPKVENMEQWSPYVSNYDNPIRFSDLLGDEPDGDDPPGWFSRTVAAVKQVASDVLDFAGGMTTALADNQTLGAYNQREQHGSKSNNRKAFDMGQDAGDMLSVGVGALEAIGGLIMTAGGILAAPETGGASLAVSATGVTVIGIGAVTAVNGVVNFSAQKGRDKGGSNNNSSNTTQSKVEKSKKTEPVGDKFTKTTEVKPGKGPGQTRAEYVRYKNKQGRVVRTYKDTYDRANKFQHRKPLRGGPEGRPQNE